MVKLSAERNRFSEARERLSLAVWVQLLFLALGISFALLRFGHKPVGSIPDDAYYIVLGRGLFSGLGYRLINFPEPLAQAPFPPGWPLLIGLYEAVLPVGLEALKIPAFLFWLGALILAVRLFTPDVMHQHRLAFVGLLLLNSKLIHMSGTVSSEPAYLFFSLLTLTLFEAWRNAEKKEWALLFFALLAAVFATLIRSIGVTLLVALAAVALWELRKRRAFKWLMFGLLLLGYAAVTTSLNGGGGRFFFLSPLYQNHIEYITTNLGRFVRFWQFGDVVEPQIVANGILPVFNFVIVQRLAGETGLMLLSWAVLGVTLLGTAVHLKKGDAKSVYTLLYLLVYYLWTVYIALTQQRIGLPLVPFLLFFFVQGVSWLAAHPGRIEAQRVVTVGLWGMVTLSVIFNVFNLNQPYYTRVTDLSIGATWIKENSTKTAVVMSTNPVQDYLYHERKSLFYNVDASLDEQIARSSVDFVLLHPPVKERGGQLELDDKTQHVVLPQLRAHPARYRLVYFDEEAAVWVFEVLQDTSS